MSGLLNHDVGVERTPAVEDVRHGRLPCHSCYSKIEAENYLPMLIFPSQAFHLGEVVAIIIGLDHGLGQSEELLSASDLSEASRVQPSLPISKDITDNIPSRLLQLKFYLF